MSADSSDTDIRPYDELESPTRATSASQKRSTASLKRTANPNGLRRLPIASKAKCKSYVVHTVNRTSPCFNMTATVEKGSSMAGSRSYINPGSLVLFLHRQGHLRPYSASYVLLDITMDI